MVVITQDGLESSYPFRPAHPRFCIFEHVYFSRPDSILGGRSVYETREAIGRELAKEAPVLADLVCPVPDSGTPAAIGYSLQSGFHMEWELFVIKIWGAHSLNLVSKFGIWAFV